MCEQRRVWFIFLSFYCFTFRLTEKHLRKLLTKYFINSVKDNRINFDLQLIAMKYLFMYMIYPFYGNVIFISRENCSLIQKGKITLHFVFIAKETMEKLPKNIFIL